MPQSIHYMKVKLLCPEEFLIALGLVIGAAEYGARGCQLCETMRDCQGGEHWESMVPEANFYIHMKFYRFKDFCHFFPFANKSQTLKNNHDPCWEFAEAVTEFNNIGNIRLKIPRWLSIDELMASCKPRKTATNGLPNISFIVRKPKPLGKFFGWLSPFYNFLLTFCFCFISRYWNEKCLLHQNRCSNASLGNSAGEGRMKTARHNSSMGATAGCTLRAIEGCAFNGQSCKGIKGYAFFGLVICASNFQFGITRPCSMSNKTQVSIPRHSLRRI